MLGAIVGGVLGAVTALLLAPKSGKELRADISEQAHQIGEKTQELAGALGARTQVLAKQVSTHADEWMHKAKEVVDTVSEEVKQWKHSRQEAAVSDDERMPADAEVLTPRELK